MPMITDQMIYNNTREAVMNGQRRLAEATARAQTGLRVSQASDDPAAAQQSVLLDAHLQQLVGMKSAADRVTTGFDNTTRDLLNVQQVLTRAKELAIQGSNETYNAGDRAAMAAEVAGLHATVLATANKQNELGEYIYSGFLTATVPFDAAGTYSGDTNVRQVEVGPNLSVTTQISGSQIFNVPGGQNVLAILQTLQTALGANDTKAVHAKLDKITAATSQVSQAQTVIGAQESMVNSAANTRELEEVSLRNTRQSSIEISAPTAFSELIEAEAAYQAAITEASRILRTLDQGITRL